MEPEPPGAAFFAWSRSRPNLVGAVAGVGSGTSDFRSRSRPKKWRLSNTGFSLSTTASTVNAYIYKVVKSVAEPLHF